MTKERQSPPAGPTPEAPVTLDALAAQVGLLAEAVARLSGANPSIPQETPAQPEIPAGEEVVDMAEHDDSIIVKAGSKTYFFDLKQTRDNKPYLLLTESRFKGEGEERERVSITVFPESAAPFGQAVAEMVDRLAGSLAE
jgi:hypothetical protein